MSARFVVAVALAAAATFVTAGPASADPGDATTSAVFDGVDTEQEWRDALSGSSATAANTINVTGSFTLSGGTDPTYAGGTQPLTVNGGGFTIDAGGTSRILLQTGVGDVTIDDITLTGGAKTQVVNGGGAVRVQGTLTITDSTLSDNAVSGFASGGGAARASTLRVIDSVVTGNRATGNAVQGGALHAATLEVTDSTVEGNSATAEGTGSQGVEGGALYSQEVTITRSTIADNASLASGTAAPDQQAAAPRGAVFTSAAGGGATTVVDSTFVGNTATAVATPTTAQVIVQGGAIWTGVKPVVVTNSTFVDNAVVGTGADRPGEGPPSGGAIKSGGLVTVVNSTFTGNSAARFAAISAVNTSFSGSVFADSQGGGGNCVTGSSSGYNFADDTSCNLVGPGDSQTSGADPGLGPLQDNGGPTLTRLPLAGSPLLDTTPTASCFTTADQRGEARPAPAGGACDTGAVEGAGGGPTNGDPVASAGPDQTVDTGASVTLDASASTDPDEDDLTYAWVQDSGPAVTLSDAAVAQPTFTAPATAGVLGFTVTVDDGNGGTDTDSVTVTVEALTPSETFVDFCYRVFLERPGEPTGVEYWGGRIDGGTTREAVARYFALSAEATRGRVLDVRYEAWLGRSPEASARDFWSGQLLGGKPILSLEVFVLASPELYGRAGGTDAGYVSELFDLLLGRAPSASDQTYWESVVAGRGRAFAAKQILTSTEAERRRVRAVFDDLLDRPPTASELTQWTAVLDATNDLRRVEVGVAAQRADD